MKENELMIGDWVMFTSKYGCGAAQIAGIEPREGTVEPTTFTILQRDKDGNTKLFIGVRKYWVKPIPLTPEILEKNGFDVNGIPENMQPVEERDWSDDTYVWSKQETPYERTQVSVYMDDPDNFFVEIICQHCHVDGIHIKYIHELQHTLRLCRVEKEIIL